MARVNRISGAFQGKPPVDKNKFSGPEKSRFQIPGLTPPYFEFLMRDFCLDEIERIIQRYSWDESRFNPSFSNYPRQMTKEQRMKALDMEIMRARQFKGIKHKD